MKILKKKKPMPVKEKMTRARKGILKKRALRKQLFIDKFSVTGGNIGKTCKLLKIARMTYYLWIRDDEEFKQKVDEAEQLFVDNVESVAFSTALKGNTSMQQFILKSKRRKTYGDRIEVDSTNKVTLALNRLSDDELRNKIKEFE